MVAYWDFPRDTGIDIKGLASRELSGNDSPLLTMVREVCQNSKDAGRDIPVKVEFHTYAMKTSEIPDLEGLRKTFECCLDMGHEFSKNTRTATTYEGMIDVLNKPEVSVMRISDFNTFGLMGSRDSSFVSPWRSFVFSSGVSDKSGESGGSKGRGKDSIGAMSSIRTVFFSTLDKDYNRASIGCSYQITHFDGDVMLSDVGRYHESEEEFSHEQLKLDPEFERTEPGTDIYILAFDESASDDSKIIFAVARDYFVEILDGRLAVCVNGVVIDKDSIERIVQDMDPSVDDSGTVELVSELIGCYKSGLKCEVPKSDYEIYLKEGRANVIASVRSGMTIDRRFYRPGGSGYIGLVVIRSSWASSMLIMAETASHDSWKSARAPEESRQAVQRLIDEIRGWIRHYVNKMQECEDAERVDATGLELFIPMVSDSFSADVAEKESLFDPVFRSTISRKVMPGSTPSDVGQNVTLPTSPIEDRLDESDEWNGPVDARNNNPKSDTPMTNLRPGTDESFKRRFHGKSVSLGNLRTFCIDPSSNKYKVMFDVKKPCTVYLEVRVYADTVERVNVVDAHDSCGNPVPFDKSRIGPIDVANQSRNFLTVSVDYPVIGRVTVVATEKTECDGQ